ncbi:MAG: UbiA family prenyltransferase [Candidatus Thermoplasmatota archaeon]|nr:UbiA family prenyltransferase [Candidatus Thermoplasmatota archaeon]
MPNLKDWLQLFRSHTSPLEMIITISGSAMAVGTIWDIKVLYFLIFGWLYHNAGYGHNSAEDYIQGFDRDDPNKSHHPIHRGAIDPLVGRGACILMVLISFIYGLFISSFDPTAITVLMLLTVFGFIYNMKGKNMGGKFLPIAIAHSLLFPFSYLGSGGEIVFRETFPFITGTLTAIMVAGTFYLIFQIIYQIMIEGDLKDIDMDEASFLRSLGVSAHRGEFKASVLARSFSVSLKTISIAFLFSIVYLGGGAAWNYLALLIFSLAMLIQDHRLMHGRDWDHSSCLKDMALMEVISTFALVFALSPIIGGWRPALIVMIANMVYFIIMNRYLWGTLMKPRV